jgi:hypothetical protein
LHILGWYRIAIGSVPANQNWSGTRIRILPDRPGGSAGPMSMLY